MIESAREGGPCGPTLDTTDSLRFSKGRELRKTDDRDARTMHAGSSS